ncbi:YhcN/YlaJ family sporulation lipoprotein [Paenibacillus chartarius]|uniref:YhcN/YlaJ family sporulation lipoprotein n=1 Tax=Paenibacillus chartarius TaxID=747481 RepID=A0ABV6DUI7_9BACL
MRRLLAAVLMLSVFVGCSQEQQQKSASPSQASNQNGVRVQQTAPAKRKILNPAEVEARFEQLAMSVPGVQAANCVVYGDMAVVGIDVKQDMDRSKIGTVKLAVAEALHKDPYGANAIVTADMDLDQRLRSIRDKAREGRPIIGFAEEMADIIGRIMPQLPSDMTRPMPDASKDANSGGTNDFSNNPHGGQ